MEVYAETIDPYRNFLNENKNKFFSILDLEGAKFIVIFKNQSVSTENYNHEDKIQSFSRWVKNALTPESEKKYDFKKIETRLSEKKTETRKNSDLRLFCMWNNYYLVKRMFTFGLITVQEGNFHVICTIEKNIDIYFINEKINEDDFYFSHKIEYRFQKYVLESNRTMVIPPGTQFLVIAPQACLFYWTIMSKHPFKFLNDEAM